MRLDQVGKVAAEEVQDIVKIFGAARATPKNASASQLNPDKSARRTAAASSVGARVDASVGTFSEAPAEKGRNEGVELETIP